MRPQTLYRREFRRLVLAEQPRSLLEVERGMTDDGAILVLLRREPSA